MKMHVFTKKICRIFCQFKKSSYLCNRKREKHSPKASQAKARQNQGSARSSIGSDARFSFLKGGFDSPTGYK